MIQRLFRALIFFSTLGLAPVIADEWISEKYRCAMTFPGSESWLPGTLQGLPAGEIIFHSNFVQNSEGIMVIVVPDQPTSDMSNPAFVRNIGEVLMSVGFATESYKQLDWLERPSGQFIARRKDAVFGSAVGVARATVRERSLYLVMAYGKGEADRADDKRFTRVLESFRFIDSGSNGAVALTARESSRYWIGSVASASAAVFLAALFCAVMFFTRHAPKEEA